MKVITLISGGDSGGAKTHVHSLLQNLSRTIEVTMVCFLEGPFAQEARELGIPTVVLSGRNLLRTYRTLKRMIREGVSAHPLPRRAGQHDGRSAAPLHRPAGGDHRPLRLPTGLPGPPPLPPHLRHHQHHRPALTDYRIGVSDAMTDLLIKRGFDPDRLFTIYNGIDFTPAPLP